MKLPFAEGKRLDVLTIGRANLDLYPPQGERLSRTRSYQAFVGGTPANVATGFVRRGLKAGLISRVAADAHGDFVCDYLQGLGVDVSQVQRDHNGHATSLAFAERCADAATIMYRHAVADLQLSAAELDGSVIADTKMLFVSGAALSVSPSREAVWRAVDLARAAKVKVVLDLDYRPYNWPDSATAAAELGRMARESDIVFGTRAEYAVAGVRDGESDEDCARHFAQADLVLIKHDKEGANAFSFRDGGLVARDRGVVYPVDVRKPWGAGDAFASSLLASLVEGEDVELALRHAAAAASINISGDSCTEAMSSRDEIEDFIRRNHARSFTTVR